MDNKITGSDMQDLDSRLTNLEMDFHMYMGKMDLLLASFMSMAGLNAGVDNMAPDGVSLERNPNLENDDIAITYSLSTEESEANSLASKFHEQVKIGTDETGKPVYKDVYGSSKRDIQAKIAKLLSGDDGSDVHVGSANRESVRNAPAQPSTDSPLWEEYAMQWYETFKLDALRPKAKTKTTNLMTKHVLPALQGKHLNEITPMDVQMALNERKDYSEAYLRDIKNLISQVLDSALEDGFVQRNVAKSKRVSIPSDKKTERQALSKEEKADIIAHIPELANANDRMFMALLMFTCLRPGEVYGLRWEDIDRDRCLIHVRRAVSFTNGKAIVGPTKTAAGVRFVPFDAMMLDFFGEPKDEGFVIRRPAGRWTAGDDEPYSEQTAKRAWQRIKKTIDVHGMTPYTARHTYATELQNNNVPMKTSMQIMGHEDERMLMRVYVHSYEQDTLNAQNRMHEYYRTIVK